MKKALYFIATLFMFSAFTKSANGARGNTESPDSTSIDYFKESTVEKPSSSPMFTEISMGAATRNFFFGTSFQHYLRISESIFLPRKRYYFRLEVQTPFPGTVRYPILQDVISTFSGITAGVGWSSPGNKSHFGQTFKGSGFGIKTGPAIATVYDKKYLQFQWGVYLNSCFSLIDSKKFLLSQTFQLEYSGWNVTWPKVSYLKYHDIASELRLFVGLHAEYKLFKKIKVDHF